MKTSLALALGLSVVAINASAETFGPNDLGAIADTYKSNELRFKRDYVNQTFWGTMPLRSIKAGMWDESKYMVGFGTGGWASDADCWVTDQKTLDFLISLDKGDKVSIRGVIDDVTMGSVQLKDCVLTQG